MNLSGHLTSWWRRKRHSIFRNHSCFAQYCIFVYSIGLGKQYVQRTQFFGWDKWCMVLTTPASLKTAQGWPPLVSESSNLFILRFADLILADKTISLLITFLGVHSPGHARYILLPNQSEITCGAILGPWNCQLLPVCVELRQNYITIRAHLSSSCNVPLS